MWPTWFYLSLGCAETKQFCLMYYTWPIFIFWRVTMMQVWRWTPWMCLNWRRHHDVKFALSQLPSSCFGIPTCCSCDCSCTCNCRGLILHQGIFKMLLLNIQKLPAQHIMLRLLGLRFYFLYGMQPTWCCLTLGCAEKTILLNVPHLIDICVLGGYHIASLTVDTVDMFELKAASWCEICIIAIAASCFGIPTCCSCDYIMIPVVVDELCIRAPSKCSCWISTGCRLSISC